MSFNIWTPHAVLSKAFTRAGHVWRIVEAQHIASTMKLVDDLDEQVILESLLEHNKPIMKKQILDLDYLFATPFRYNPKKGGSRFRSEIDPGVFYGAQSIRTAGAELGYWRWRFLKDSVDLDQLGPVPHTVFSCKPSCSAVDLRQAPFVKDQLIWGESDQDVGTQAFARTARKAKVQSIVYQSVRDKTPAWCIAILDPSIFSTLKPIIDHQNWFLSVSQSHVCLKSQREAYTFDFNDGY